jgi:hypothetical protein
MEHLIILAMFWMLLGRWFWWGPFGRRGRWMQKRLARPLAYDRIERGRWGGAGRGCGASMRRDQVARVESESAWPTSRRQTTLDTAAPTAVRSDDPVARLQREWIEGRITDEAYENGLDAIYSSRRL